MLPALYFAIGMRLRIRFSDDALYKGAKNCFTRTVDRCNEQLASIRYHTPVKVQKKIDDTKLIFTLSASVVTSRNILLAYEAWGAEWEKYNFRDKEDYNLTMCLKLIALSQKLIENCIEIDPHCWVLYERDVESHVGSGKRRKRRDNFEFEDGDPRFASYFCYAVKREDDAKCFVRFVKKVGVDSRGEIIPTSVKEGLANDLCSDLSTYKEFIEFDPCFDLKSYLTQSDTYFIACDTSTEPFDIVATSPKPFPKSKAMKQKEKEAKDNKESLKTAENWFASNDWFSSSKSNVASPKETAKVEEKEELTCVIDGQNATLTYYCGEKKISEDAFKRSLNPSSIAVIDMTKNAMEKLCNIAKIVTSRFYLEMSPKDVMLKSYEDLLGFLPHVFFDFTLSLSTSKTNSGFKKATSLSEPCGKASSGVLRLKPGKMPFCSYDESIVTLIIEDGVDVIPGGAFFHCSNLREVLGGKDLTRLGAFAFYNCEQLETFEPSGLKDIGDHAFEGCSHLSLPLQKSIEKYGIGALDGCLNTKEIIFADSPLFQYMGEDFPHLNTLRFPDVFPIKSRGILNSDVTRIQIPLDLKCETIILPKAVDAEGKGRYLDYAFSGPEIDYIIPEGVEGVGVYVTVRSIRIPKTVNDIFFSNPCENIELDPDNPFMVFDGRILKSKDGKYWFCAPTHFSKEFPKRVPNDIESMPAWVIALFDPINLPECFDDYALFDFYVWNDNGRGNQTTKKTVYNLVEYIGKAGNPYYMAVNIQMYRQKTIEFHPSTRVIAFNSSRGNFSYIETVNMPDSVTSLLRGCFRQFGKLTSVRLSSNITEIPPSCFEDCTSLKVVSLPDELESIGESAFKGTNIESINFPSSLKLIRTNAFGYCYGLKTVAISADTIIQEGAFAYGTKIIKK